MVKPTNNQIIQLSIYYLKVLTGNTSLFCVLYSGQNTYMEGEETLKIVPCEVKSRPGSKASSRASSRYGSQFHPDRTKLDIKVFD